MFQWRVDHGGQLQLTSFVVTQLAVHCMLFKNSSDRTNSAAERKTQKETQVWGNISLANHPTR